MDIMALLLQFHTPLAWLGLGVLLMIAEVLSGEGSLLAFGLSALSVALLLCLSGYQPPATPAATLGVWVLFAALGVPMAYAIRRLLRARNADQSDINTY